MPQMKQFKITSEGLAIPQETSKSIFLLGGFEIDLLKYELSD